MRVGILTFHEIFNPGAYLQALATQELLRAMGHDALVIDYTSPAHRFRPLRELRHPWMWMHLRDWGELFVRHRAFRQVQDRFHKTPRLLTYADVEAQVFDAVLIGADIVWNYKLEVLGRDPIYYGKHLNTRRLIAWAPSFGNCTLEDAPATYVAKGLRRFDHISVRDERSRELVRRFTGREVRLLCDPSFHLATEGWIQKPEPSHPPYLLVYAMPTMLSNELISATIAYARLKHLRLVAVCYRHNWVDENQVGVNPFQWLGFIQQAQAVVTNSFHGTIFAVKAGRRFVTEYNCAIRTKTEPMINELGLRSRIWAANGSLPSLLESPWNVAGVHATMRKMADEARAYLQHALA